MKNYMKEVFNPVMLLEEKPELSANISYSFGQLILLIV